MEREKKRKGESREGERGEEREKERTKGGERGRQYESKRKSGRNRGGGRGRVEERKRERDRERKKKECCLTDICSASLCLPLLLHKSLLSNCDMATTTTTRLHPHHGGTSVPVPADRREANLVPTGSPESSDRVLMSQTIQASLMGYDG